MVTVYPGFCTPQHGSKATVRMINTDASGATGTASPDTTDWVASFDTLFDKTSLWNATPVNPVLGTTTIPDVNELATVTDDAAFGIRFYRAVASDPPATVNATNSENGNPAVITVPHWPANAVAPTGSDAHVEVFDETTGLIHSCWGFNNGPPKTCGKYTCERFDGSGWGTPERPDGPRGAGITVVAGTLRTWETNLSEAPHALAVVLGDVSHCRNIPIFPATEQDAGTGASFVGDFPYGTLFMLPPTFDYSGFLTEMAKKIARTLMKRGAYMIDLGAGGWVICAEYGGTWSEANQWNGTQCVDIESMKHALRPVVSVSGWLDANGDPFDPTQWDAMNIISMRGPWSSSSGDVVQSGSFNTQTARYEYPVTVIASITNVKAIYPRDDAATDPTHQWWNGQFYTNPTQGASYTLTAVGDSGVTGNIYIYPADFSTLLWYSNDLAGGQSQTFTMPSHALGILIQVHHTKVAGPAASIRLELVKN